MDSLFPFYIISHTEKKEEVKPEEVKPEVKKYVSTLWISEEKKMFFEALNEFGKDFESIHSYICTRLKKKGIPDDQLKTKPQIRHFYYKTFHMLSGNLKFNESTCLFWFYCHSFDCYRSSKKCARTVHFD